MIRLCSNLVIQGRFTGEPEIAQVRLLLSEHGDWGRWRVSQHLARLWEWRSASGQLKDMAARTLLLKLEEPLCGNLLPCGQLAHGGSDHRAHPAEQNDDPAGGPQSAGSRGGRHYPRTHARPLFFRKFDLNSCFRSTLQRAFFSLQLARFSVGSRPFSMAMARRQIGKPSPVTPCFLHPA